MKTNMTVNVFDDPEIGDIKVHISGTWQNTGKNFRNWNDALEYVRLKKSTQDECNKQ